MSRYTNEKKQAEANSEMEALNNALNSFKMEGFTVYHQPMRTNTYFLRDPDGNSITGYWDYTKLNHFIMGFGAAKKRYSIHQF